MIRTTLSGWPVSAPLPYRGPSRGRDQSPDALLLKKHPADHGIQSAGLSDVDFHVSGTVPNQVKPIGEAGDALSIQHGAGIRIQDLNGFRSPCGVPIQGVECKPM